MQANKTMTEKKPAPKKLNNLTPPKTDDGVEMHPRRSGEDDGEYQSGE